MGLLWSEDAGETWTPSCAELAAFDPTDGGPPALVQADGRVLLAAPDGAVWISPGGCTVQATGLPRVQWQQIALDPQGAAYLSRSNGLGGYTYETRLFRLAQSASSVEYSAPADPNFRADSLHVAAADQPMLLGESGPADARRPAAFLANNGAWTQLQFPAELGLGGERFTFRWSAALPDGRRWALLQVDLYPDDHLRLLELPVDSTDWTLGPALPALSSLLPQAALSADGTTFYLATPEAGLFRLDTTAAGTERDSATPPDSGSGEPGDSQLQSVGTWRVSCLSASSEGLLFCGDANIDGFLFARLHGEVAQPLAGLEALCASPACPEGTSPAAQAEAAFCAESWAARTDAWTLTCAADTAAPTDSPSPSKRTDSGCSHSPRQSHLLVFLSIFALLFRPNQPARRYS
jgi:hypothetical protein